MKQKDDVVIATLKYLKAHMVTGALRDKAQAHLGEQGYEMTPGSPTAQIFGAVWVWNSDPVVGTKTSESDPAIINENGYFHLLEYEELAHARESSAAASRQARNAFYVSAAAMAISFIIGLLQLIK